MLLESGCRAGGQRLNGDAALAAADLGLIIRMTTAPRSEPDRGQSLHSRPFESQRPQGTTSLQGRDQLQRQMVWTPLREAF